MTQHSSTTGYATLDLYNPFENTTAVSNSYSLPVRRRRTLYYCYGGEIKVLLHTRHMHYIWISSKRMQSFMGDMSECGTLDRASEHSEHLNKALKMSHRHYCHQQLGFKSLQPPAQSPID